MLLPVTIQEPRKILVRAPNWVGDIVMSLPALKGLCEKFPGAELSVLVHSHLAGLYEGVPGVNRVIGYDKKGRHGGASGLFRLAGELRQENFDLAVLWQNAFEAALIVRLAGIPQRLGYSRDARGWLLTHPVPVAHPPAIPAHESYYYLELLRRAGLLDELPAVDRVNLSPDPARVQEMQSRLAESGARDRALRVVLAPGAAYGSAKCWLPERFAEVADRLVETRDAAILLCGTPAEARLGEEIARRMKSPPISFIGKTTLPEFFALLSCANFFIGNDSGAMHLAAAAGLPQVIIFGPTDENGTAPLHPRARLVRQPTGCSPCFLRHCPIDHRCMTRVTVEEVWRTVEAALAETGKGTGE